MARLPRLAWILLVTLSLGGRGEGYILAPATLNIAEATEESKTQLLTVVSGFLRQEGFEDFGRYDAMIALIEEDRATPKAVKEFQLARLNREHTFLNDRQRLRVVLADYTHSTPSEFPGLSYTPLSNQFVEINTYEERPGGFSPEGLRFYERFLGALRAKFGTSPVVVVHSPPPTNDSEYRRITRVNAEASVVGWLVAVLILLAITGSISVFLLKQLKSSTMIKRIIFTLVNTWLVVPLLFPGGYIFVFPGPNLLAFPWTDFNFYSKSASYAKVSFPCALAVCAVASMILIKSRSKADASPWHS
jgi:hypothetical protein